MNKLNVICVCVLAFVSSCEADGPCHELDSINYCIDHSFILHESDKLNYFKYIGTARNEFYEIWISKGDRDFPDFKTLGNDVYENVFDLKNEYILQKHIVQEFRTKEELKLPKVFILKYTSRESGVSVAFLGKEREKVLTISETFKSKLEEK